MPPASQLWPCYWVSVWGTNASWADWHWKDQTHSACTLWLFYSSLCFFLNRIFVGYLWNAGPCTWCWSQGQLDEWQGPVQNKNVETLLQTARKKMLPKVLKYKNVPFLVVSQLWVVSLTLQIYIVLCKEIFTMLSWHKSLPFVFIFCNFVLNADMGTFSSRAESQKTHNTHLVAHISVYVFCF